MQTAHAAPQPNRSTAMSSTDDYASRSGNRRRAYVAAYRSPEARAWIASLTPEQRRRAEELGLLTPMLDPQPADISTDDLPTSATPTCEPIINDPAEEAHAALLRRLGHISEVTLQELTLHQRHMLSAYASRKGSRSAVQQRCLCFLLGLGTGEKHARALGMSRQLFDYHVLQMQAELRLPALGFSRSDGQSE